MIYPPPEKWEAWASEQAAALTRAKFETPAMLSSAIQYTLIEAMQWVVDMAELRLAIEQSPSFTPLNADAAKRASGRTTRMLKAAYQAHLDGKAVYVLGLNMGHARLLKAEMAKSIARLPDESLSSIKFETPQHLSNFDIMTGRWSGRVWQNVMAFVDHAVYLQHFGAQWKLMSRWDEPEEQS